MVDEEEPIVMNGCSAGSAKQEKEMAEYDPVIQDRLLYTVDDVPPWHQCFTYGFQQYLLAAGGLMSLPLVVMDVLCADDSEQANMMRTSLLGTVFVVAGLSTFLQCTFGLRLPIVQGITVSYFIPTFVILSSEEWKCPAALDLSPNSSVTDIVIYGNSSRQYIFDSLHNSSIEIEHGLNYYRDNDGIIADSKEVWIKRVREVQGAVIACSLLQMAIGVSGIMGLLLKHIGPLTVSPVLLLITLSLTQVALDQARTQWWIAMFIVLVFYVSTLIINRVKIPLPKINFSKRRCELTRYAVFGQFPVIIAVACGWLLCVIVTFAGGFSDDPNSPTYQARADAKGDVILNSPWFNVPYPGQWGLPTLSMTSVFGMFAGVFPGILESIGVYQTCAKITREPQPPRYAVNRAVFMEGVGIFLAGIFGNGNSTTSFSDNIVAIDVSRVASRRVFQWTSAILIFLGLFGKFCSIFVTLPDAVIGGIMIAVLGSIGSIGVSMLKKVDMNCSRNLFIFGFSIFFGVSISMYAKAYPEEITVGVPQIDQIIVILLQIPMFIGGLSGFILDNITPGDRRSRGLMELDADLDSNDAPVYQLPFRTNFSWTKWIPFCRNYDSNEEECSADA